ncbi:MAG: LysR family transcriptional regulator [Gammaproteobacteria bacterium]|nr:MAG: LysR family transcriptional regulator [Gammaproteobacteria bacterium]
MRQAQLWRSAGIAVHLIISKAAFDKFEREDAMPQSLLPKMLRYAEVVARAGSVQAAARVLNLSASAIDRQILLLEDLLGAPLFERQPDGMRLSAAGELVVTLAKRWQHDASRLLTDIRQLQGINQGSLRLAAMDSHANGLMPVFLERLHREHPRIRLEIDIVSPDQAEAALIAGTTDLAIAFNLKAGRDLHLVMQAELPLGCVVAPGHPLAGQPDTSLKAVSGYPIVSQNRSLTIRRYLESRHGWLFAEREAPVQTNSLQLVKHLAAAGSHVALTSELDAAPEILAGRLCFIPLTDRNVQPQTVAIAISARRPLPRIGRLVADLLAEELRGCLEAVRQRRAAGSGG